VRENLDLLRWSFDGFKARQLAASLEIPQNRNLSSDLDGNKLLRYLDCSVIRDLDKILDDQPPDGYPEVGGYVEPFDSVRGMFKEGRELYDGARIFDLTHTQISVQNDDCIKGFFLPR
jgi:hypothetical protein